MGKSNVKGTKHSRDKRFIFLMLLPALIFIAVFTYYPLLKGVTMAFQDYNLFNINNTKWIGLDNFKEILTPSAMNNFYQVLYNTVKWVVVSLFFQFLIGFALALLLNRPFRGVGLYKGIAFMPYAVSGFVIGIVWRWMYNGTSGVLNDLFMRIGIIDQPIGFLAQTETALNSVIAANIWYGIPFFTIMIGAALQGVPEDLYEAAKVDGAGAFRRFFSITLPFIKPVLVLTLLLRVIWIFNMPDMIYSMTNGGPAGSSRILTSYMIEYIYTNDYGMGSAFGVIIMVILSVYTLIYLRFTKFEDMGDY